MREIGSKEEGELRGLSHLMGRNNRRCLPEGRKRMQRSGKIEDVKEKIYTKARKVL